MRLTAQASFLKQLAKGLAIQFGSKCEVVIHDLTSGPKNTIIAIENGQVTGRRVGDDASSIVARVLQDPSVAEDSMGYQTRTQDGRTLRSSSIYLRDESGHPIALLSINYDFTELSHASSILTQFMGVQNESQNQNGIDTIFSNVNDMLDRLLKDSVSYAGKPVALMDKEDKVKAIKYLDERGAFLIMKSGDKVSQFFDISKYTLYNYLDKNGKAADHEPNQDNPQ